MTISEKHLAELRASGLTDETVAGADLYAAEGQQVTDMLGFRPPHSHWGPCLVYPYFDAQGTQTGYCRVKPDFPVINEEGKPRKYEAPRNKPNRAYFPPHFAERWKSASTVIITEGEKKALALDQAGYCVIGISGVWNWQRKRPRGDTGKAFGARRLIPDIAALDFKGKIIHICFDSDAVDNDLVLIAEHTLANLFASQGVATKVIRLPQADSEKVGVDDFIVAHGLDAFRQLIACAAEPQMPPPPSPLDWGRMFINEHFTGEQGLELRWWRDEFYRWDRRCFVRVNDSELEAILLGWLDERSKQATPRRAAEIVTAMHTLCRVSNDLEMPTWISENHAHSKPIDIIPMHNGLLDISNVGGDLLLHDHTPGFFSSNVLPYRFDPSAECPTWVEFLEQVFDRDAECIKLLQTWLGLCLTADTSYQKLLLMHGPTRAGKGVITRVVEQLVGRDNCVSPALSSLSTEFGLWQMLGKTVAIFGDAHLSHRADSVRIMEVIKSIVGEDAVAINRKNLSYLTSVRLNTRFLITVNELPKFSDASGSLGTRILPLAFEQSFAGREDRTLETRIAAEIPGIFNWSLRGLFILRTEGRFVVPSKSHAIMENYRRLSAPVVGFVEDACELNPDQRVQVDFAYEAWCGWCRENGNLPGSKETFGQHLRAAFPKVERKLRRVGEFKQTQSIESQNFTGPNKKENRRYFYEGLSLADEGVRLMIEQRERMKGKGTTQNEK